MIYSEHTIPNAPKQTQALLKPLRQRETEQAATSLGSPVAAGRVTREAVYTLSVQPLSPTVC